MSLLSPPRVTFTVGAPGCGKTTYARRVRAELGYALLSLDDFRAALCGCKADFWDPATGRARDARLKEAVHALHLGALRDLLDRGLSVVVHNTHADPASFAPEWQAVAQRGILPDVVVWDVPLDELLRRNAERPKDDRVPEAVIASMRLRLSAADAWWRGAPNLVAAS